MKMSNMPIASAFPNPHDRTASRTGTHDNHHGERRSGTAILDRRSKNLIQRRLGQSASDATVYRLRAECHRISGVCIMFDDLRMQVTGTFRAK